MIDDIDLIERTKRALENFSDRPWLPDLTGDLVKSGWDTLYQETGISFSDYGTARVIAKSVHAHRELAGYLSTSSAVEILDDKLAAHYRDAGVEFYTAKEITDAYFLGCVEEAINLIKRIPTLHATVSALVRSIHLIKPEDDDYDVSFSEPQIPFSIFVSVPRQQSSTTALRIAEAVVHEAMHLQLTLVERIAPLIVSTSQQYYSPWRKEHRDARGILHALYVFKVIDRTLKQLASTGCFTIDVAEYIGRRQYDIDRQTQEIQSFQDCSELTSIGARFVQRLIGNLLTEALISY